MCINLSISKLFGINFNKNLIQSASSFISCGVEYFPFKFLGVFVGSNPRRKSSWNMVISKMPKKLSSWREKQMTLGDRISMLNMVLTNLNLVGMCVCVCVCVCVRVHAVAT